MKNKRTHSLNFLSRLIFLLLSPVFFQYFAFGFIWHSIYWGVITFVIIIWSTLILISPFFGRIGCGWFCFMGTIMDFAGKHSFCKTTYNRPKTWIKLLILIPFFTSAFTFYFLNKEHGLTHNFEVNPDFLPLNMDMHYKIVWMCDIFFAILIAVFLDKRWGCRHLCMMGTLTSIGAKYSRLLVVVDTNECTNCGRCEKECLSAIPLLNYIKDNKGLIANPECLLCGKCLQTCKSNAISLKFIWNRSKYKQENKASSNSFIHGS